MNARGNGPDPLVWNMRGVSGRRGLWALVRPLGIAVSLGFLLALAAGCKKKPEAPAESATAPPTVHLTQPQQRDIVVEVGQPSFVEAYERTSIYPKLTAYIEKWYVDIGDRVKSGQVLADLFVPEVQEDYRTKAATIELDKQQVRLAMQQVKVAEANVKAAAARLKEAEAILDEWQAQVHRWSVQVARLQREMERGVVDPQIVLESENQLRASTAKRDAAEADIAKAAADLESRKAALREAQVAVDVAQAAVAVATSNWKRLGAWVGYLKLYAPFDGIISARNANTGDFVLPMTGDPTADMRAPDLSPGRKAAPVFVVDRVDVVRVFVDVPEADANYVKQGTRASVLVKAFRDQPIPAQVTRTSWALNVTSRTLRAEIDLVNDKLPQEYVDRGAHQMAADQTVLSNPQILPGMYAYGTVIIERSKVLAIPVEALLRVGDKSFCWLYRDGKALRSETTVGVSDGKWVEVLNRRVGETEAATSPRRGWTQFDGTEQLILGDLSLLTDGAPVEAAAAGKD